MKKLRPLFNDATTGEAIHIKRKDVISFSQTSDAMPSTNINVQTPRGIKTHKVKGGLGDIGRKLRLGLNIPILIDPDSKIGISALKIKFAKESDQGTSINLGSHGTLTTQKSMTECHGGIPFKFTDRNKGTLLELEHEGNLLHIWNRDILNVHKSGAHKRKVTTDIPGLGSFLTLSPVHVPKAPKKHTHRPPPQTPQFFSTHG
jgi:hypothetical protein